jgi:hypothetical protein
MSLKRSPHQLVILLSLLHHNMRRAICSKITIAAVSTRALATSKHEFRKGSKPSQNVGNADQQVTKNRDATNRTHPQVKGRHTVDDVQRPQTRE